MDAITMLREDHKTVERLFKEFERAKPGAGAARQRLVRQIVEELSRHAAVEEQAFYPAVRAALPDTADTILEAVEEHYVMKRTLAELDAADPGDERFRAKVTVLIESVRHHVREEEDELFPQVRQALGRKALQELAATMAEVRKAAPARPAPDDGLTEATAQITRRALQAVGVEDGGGRRSGRATAGRSR